MGTLNNIKVLRLEKFTDVYGQKYESNIIYLILVSKYLNHNEVLYLTVRNCKITNDVFWTKEKWFVTLTQQEKRVAIWEL